MGKKALSARKNWQHQGGIKAAQAETDLYEVFNEYFAGTEYILHKKPKHLKNLYANVRLPQNVLDQIYNPVIDRMQAVAMRTKDCVSSLRRGL